MPDGPMYDNEQVDEARTLLIRQRLSVLPDKQLLCLMRDIDRLERDDVASMRIAKLLEGIAATEAITLRLN